ncbi:MAG: hypothetical protein ABJE95_33350 [Byssovorax sp.]
MDYPQFQIAAVELASEGTPLTVANVVVGLRIGASEAGRHLERMTKEGHLDADFDAAEGVAVYRVRGLTTKRRGDSLVSTLRNAAVGSVIQQRLGIGGASKFLAGGQPPRKIATGVLLAGIVPGLGLAYAAPWKIVALATVVVVVGFKVLAFFSLMLAVPFLAVAAAISAILGGLYTWQFNQTGRRVALSSDPEIRRRLPGKLKDL